ncbi:MULTISPECIES: hypothetical protein [unclassified Pseudomonas]|uniref:hypothetical protein n=1 Tax=unclassified Pseudomonas TaxID=196821 RepID=UPI00069126AD|nr:MULTISPECIES: hypothetical protein [unclassified Pseudomonas]MBB1609830.1 hypothetical protein [Pseudomonas sp. UMC76]MBB1641070.1 hypothetical protein [Pseudomonas sp. UME83]NTX93372.1 hypothetical protein [Pseudomonas sp. UMA643]NTY34815.1 hypothetical protein [Pseudomonas sp. UMC3129]NTY57916.1 hypothetical protein [Pseudomonas sp. UMC631]
MANGGSLMEQFIAQEFNSSVRSVLNRAIDERVRSDNVLIREFEFNCFDVALDFERGVVKLQDALSSGVESSTELPLSDFISACGLNLL